MPVPGVLVHLSPEFNPARFRGMVIHRNDPFRIDFYINKGDQELTDTQKKSEYQDLVKYFLAALAIPDEDQWVNLSPYEKNRIIAADFSRTTMGRDLLAEDYILKQITASIIYPEEQLGKKFWNRVYDQAQKQFGTTNIPVNTFNKVWIVPQKAVVYEDAKAGAVYIVDSKLKVMLEEDYLSLEKHTGITKKSVLSPTSAVNALGSKIVREVVLPELVKEVNQGKNFAPLRQIYSAMILATWYKKALKTSILAKIYNDKVKLQGIAQNPKSNELIYLRYMKAFKKGVYNYIKDEVDPITQQEIPKKYFSGGFLRGRSSMAMLNKLTPQQRSSFQSEADLGQIVRVPVALLPTRNVSSAMRSPIRGGNMLTRAIYVGLLMTQLFVTNVKAIDRLAIINQNRIYNITTPVNDQTIQQGLNNVFKIYMGLNGNQLIKNKEQMPNLSKLIAGSGIESILTIDVSAIEEIGLLGPVHAAGPDVAEGVDIGIDKAVARRDIAQG